MNKKEQNTTSELRIETKDTPEISDSEWISYTNSFNLVFDQSFSSHTFKHKYLLTTDQCSYHCFYYDKDEIIGAFTVIPYEYLIKDKIYKFGLAVDVFILEGYRNDPLGILKMFKQLILKLQNAGIILLIGVPNDQAYSYWKKVLKWDDIGNIPYYAIPVNAGNVAFRQNRFFNYLNKMFLKLWLNNWNLTNNIEEKLPIRINKNLEILQEQRYTSNHSQISNSDIYFSYRVVNEKGIKTGYIIDFYNNQTRQKDKRSLIKAIKYIIRNEQVDLLLYVGKLNFKQMVLFKVPYKHEPKHLFFCSKIIVENKIDEGFIQNFRNWDFSLFNYDVR